MNHVKHAGTSRFSRTKGSRPATLAAVLAASLGFSGLAGAAAPSYPDKSRPIQVIVPFSAGGPTDIQTRIIADFMSRDLGTNFVVQAFDEIKAGKPVSNASPAPYGCSVKYAAG